MESSELVSLTIHKARELLDGRELSSVELTRAVLDRIHQVEPRVKAFVTVTGEVALEQARSMSMFATMASDFSDAKERSSAVAAAKVQVGKSLKFVGQQSIQLHGGIGMTMEAKIGHYFKRLTMIENTLGDTDYHLRRVSESGGLLA